MQVVNLQHQQNEARRPSLVSDLSEETRAEFIVGDSRPWGVRSSHDICQHPTADCHREIHVRSSCKTSSQVWVLHDMASDPDAEPPDDGAHAEDEEDLVQDGMERDREQESRPKKKTRAPDDGDDGDGEDEDDDDEEPQLKYARLTSSLGGLYRNGDATSAFLVAGDKMVGGVAMARQCEPTRSND